MIVIRMCDTNRRVKSKSHGRGGRVTSWISLYVWGITPYIFTCSVRHFLDNNNSTVKTFDNILSNVVQDALPSTSMITWFYFMFILALCGLLYIFLGIVINARYFCTFWQANFTSVRTGSRKIWRFLDTCGSICTLIGLIIGVASLFVDQFDIGNPNMNIITLPGGAVVIFQISPCAFMAI